MLLNDLGGAGEDQWRHGQAELLSGVEVDDQLEGGRLLDRQVSGHRAFEDPSGVNAELAKGRSDARPIADQAPGSGEFTQCIDRRNGMARRQPDELLAPAGEEWLATDNEPVGMQLEEGRKSGVDFVFGAGL